jgi:transcription antitermination factor NusG
MEGMSAAFINTNMHNNVIRELRKKFPDEEFEFLNPQFRQDDTNIPFYQSYIFIAWKGKESQFVNFESKCSHIIRFLKHKDSTGLCRLSLINPDEIESIRELESSFSTYYDSYKKYEGKVVGFSNGIFQGYKGILREINPSKAEAIVDVNLFGDRQIPTTAKIEDLEIDLGGK